MATKFIKYENGTYASYKTTFERAIFALNISIDDNSKINGLLVKPFVEEVHSENVINNLSIKDSLITQDQSEIMFENAKIFPNHTQIAIAMDAANSELWNAKKKKYVFFKSDKSVKSSDEMIKIYENLTKNYPLLK